MVRIPSINIFSLNFYIWTLFYTIALYGEDVNSTGYGYGVPMSRNICSQKCTKWKPKHCWDGYLKRKVWKMVCENYDIKCCPGYDGPKCENECFTCDRVNTIERRIVDIYGKIQAVDDKCTNRTVIINGGSENTGDNITKECTCPAGPRGDRGPQGPAGSPGRPGQPGLRGQKGDIGPSGLPGDTGRDGLDGLNGSPGRPGQKGDPGQPGDPGSSGFPGPAGPEGPPGLPGIDGPAGRPGLPGSASAKGEAGPPGRDGVSGRPGRPGQKGDPGIPGVPGLPGQKGERGSQGSDGRNGFPGAKGGMGDNGRPGPRGLNGDVGPIGPPGRKGEEGLRGYDGLPGQPGDITKVEESHVIQTMQNTIQNLVTQLETVTKEVEELRIVCNGIAGCRFNCTPESFKCSCGMCIPSRFRCDGFPQCPDGSDELEAECDYICDVGQFKCESSGLCIPISKQCNGVIDCSDGSDESSRYCSDPINCNEGNVPCRDGTKCVAREERCDGKPDCPDASDEENCGCGRGEFECASRDECISIDKQCDNIPDCADGSDEIPAICSTGLICAEGQRACRDQSACINTDQFCDQIKNCYDGSDEINCELAPSPTPSVTALPSPNNIDITRTLPTTTTTLPTTTTSSFPSITDDEFEGSGDLVLDRALCKELYEKWNDPAFPGGEPPPLHPVDAINWQLCNYMLHRAKESCATGAGDTSQNVALCQLVNNLELSSLNTRQKRHKQQDSTDDDEVTSDEQYAVGKDDMSDISFYETEIENINKVEIEPVAMAYESTSSATVSALSVSLAFACSYITLIL